MGLLELELSKSSRLSSDDVTILKGYKHEVSRLKDIRGSVLLSDRLFEALNSQSNRVLGFSFIQKYTIIECKLCHPWITHCSYKPKI